MEAELQSAGQVVKVQAKNPVAIDQSTSGHTITLIYASLQSRELLSPEELQLGGIELMRLNARREALHILYWRYFW